MDLPAARRPSHLPPQLTDPRLRAQLPAAVHARPLDEPVDRQVWWQVVACLEATSHAAACAGDGTDLASTAALVAFALDDALCARQALQRDLPGAAHPSRMPRDQVAVERTWFRLAGLLATPAPVDPALLARAVDGHVVALAAWRDALRAALRLHRLPAAV